MADGDAPEAVLRQLQAAADAAQRSFGVVLTEDARRRLLGYLDNAARRIVAEIAPAR